ncbi:hypothetical protein BAUCODRAFT_63868 [Baudoinia panamericana UAMH 10762]|uniref:PUM-HD domain-containing protein n=1 Tax=Baudoinia panamericana (strain UAMH 10762) TaxID=717646 RepID=M2MTN7_BAUPA|nr:uncharacterized protein BAUCODRAFT_63868 [Baudoinia panamericana UAMH 10762]EMD00277.1 hypothetical protein BAUCODRAFT_63868 [Baudoinia panamericana UAMH 10762]
MPQENKKRGRRMNKRKAEDEGSAIQQTSKRQKSNEDLNQQADFVPLQAQEESVDNAYPAAEKPFFGMLDAEEQEHFKQAYEQLDPTSFGDLEDPDTFLTNVWKDAEGKELKIAQSQSCSRLMERLIQLSTASQLKKLFQAFSGNFIHLVSHRFASHCCEALFLRAAPLVTEELIAPRLADGVNTKDTTALDEIYVSMENLFLHTLAEFEGSFGFLMTDSFASHALRVLLLVLSGEPTESASAKRLLQSKRKEGALMPGTGGTGGEAQEKTRTVPKAFGEKLEKVIADSIAGLDTDKLRALATHPQANPTLQLLLKLELTQFGKERAKDERSVIRTLLPDEPITAESGSATFINGIIYDSVGSHLVEQIVQHAPGKTFKSLYREFFKERLASFARNEVAGYVVCRLLERMSRDDLYDAHEVLLPTLPNLLERNRTMVIATLIERCAVRDIDTTALAAELDRSVQCQDGFDVKKFLKVERAQPDGHTRTSETPHDSVQSSNDMDEVAAFVRPTEPAKVHFNLLAQAMLRVPGPMCGLILDSLVQLDPPTLQQMAADSIVTRTMQAALTSKNASIIQKRKLIQLFYGHIGEMAVERSASHVVDCIWEGTHGLAFIRERIAEELAENEGTIRESSYGRSVWKNWKMDMYKRRRAEWIKQSKFKASNDGFQSFSEIDSNKKQDETGGAVGKTPLELARERHLNKKREKEKQEKKEKKGKEKEGATLLSAVKDSVIQFIRAADDDASSKSSGHGLQQSGQGPRTVLVEHHPPKKLQQLLNVDLPVEGQGKAGLLRTVEEVLHYSVNTWDQGFMDKLYSSITPVGLASDLLLSALNTNLHVYQVSPALTVIEKQTAKALATMFGFKGPFAGGVSQPGGSAANQSSIVVARNCLYPETKTKGYEGRSFVLFTSAHGHYSLEKAAQMFGFGSEAVKSVSVDERGCMKADELERMIEQAKRDGETPFYVNATAGTTVLGSYDPLEQISDVCRKHGLWMHVDGSWGGPVIFSEKQRHKLQGVEKADSIAICPHKMMAVPVTCSFLLGKDLRQFHKGMTLPAGYLFHSNDVDEGSGVANGHHDQSAVDTDHPHAHPNQEEDVKEFWDLADLTPQCGRRGDSLKLALSWIYYGTTGFGDMIDHAFSMAAYLASLVASNSNFTLVSDNPPPCLQVCFYFNGQEGVGHRNRNSKITEEITKRLIPRGFMIDYAPGDEGKFFRVVVNVQTRKETVEGLVKAIQEVGDGLDVKTLG